MAADNRMIGQPRPRQSTITGTFFVINFRAVNQTERLETDGLGVDIWHITDEYGLRIKIIPGNDVTPTVDFPWHLVHR